MNEEISIKKLVENSVGSTQQSTTLHEGDNGESLLEKLKKMRDL